MNDQMECHIDLDWCTYYCPCGESFCTREAIRRSNGDEEIDQWLADHKPHTNGKLLEHTTVDGQRAWGGPVPDELKDLR